MEWHYHKGNPILALGPRGTWAEAYATWASVVRIGQADWRMYYSGKNKTAWWRSPRLRIGLALSADGSHWRKFDGNPILDTGREAEWDSRGVYCPVVWQERGSWHMIFTGCNN